MGFESLPKGTILVWTGTLAGIPLGWDLCDGNNGTPDLLDKYLMGVPTVSTDPGATGGATSHSHGSPSHVHSYAHSHTLLAPGGVIQTMGEYQAALSTHYHDASGSADVSGSMTVDEAVDVEPPYYTVAFIMKR